MDRQKNKQTKKKQTLPFQGLLSDKFFVLFFSARTSVRENEKIWKFLSQSIEKNEKASLYKN